MRSKTTKTLKRHMRPLRVKFPLMHGLHATVLGVCVKNVSAPMFTAVSVGVKVFRH